ncbi:MAG TPA: DNA recombination protein RmuC, partial [Thauera aminoaromatica]|nr:DNA recombination protein RmuC [Thauera aminoaromatica]
MTSLQLTPAEWLLAGLLVAVLVLQAWGLLRGGGAERRLREGLGDDLTDFMEQRLAARHRELLLDLHDGLAVARGQAHRRAR